MELDARLQGSWVQGLLLGFLVLADKEKLPKCFFRVIMSLMTTACRLVGPGLKLLCGGRLRACLQQPQGT